MTAYYNEFNPFAAQWLRNLIAAGHIAPGEVDERSIEDVRPADLVGYRQCHFFAGIGIWSHALRCAGVGDDTPVWTGSCPCQPFSAAGEGEGFADERHLWPAFFHLIEQCRPSIVLGEQVANKDAEPWLDLVHADLEAVGYAFGAVAFPAAGIGAPHIRDRLYWAASDGVAQGDTIGARLEGHAGHGNDSHEPGRLAAHSTGPAPAASSVDRLEHAAGRGRGIVGSTLGARDVRHADGTGDALVGLAESERERHDGRGSAGSAGSAEQRRLDAARCSAPAEQAGPVNGHWRVADWLFCRDGTWRPVEPGTFPLASIPARGVGPVESGILKLARSNRVGRLRGYGNGINADAARIFIECVKEITP